MKFIFFLFILLSCSYSCILHKTTELEFLPIEKIYSNKHLYEIENDFLLFEEELIDKSELYLYSSMLILEKQSKELLYTKDLIPVDILNHSINIELDFKENWLEKNKKNLKFIYGATILFITYVTVRWN